MKQRYILRVKEEHAGRLFAADEGRRVGVTGLVREIRLDADDPRIGAVAATQRELRAQRDPLYFGWEIAREYSPAEWKAAALLQLIPAAQID